ncbi:hypothetical protein [Nocardia inohanensis]|uniref:hypothetical protein n=1 Tax=Nocardia inohanensis TaxID=209246 RepID=UPI0008326D6F|nr:hypothetical protein [Nocardia inohanensis]
MADISFPAHITVDRAPDIDGLPVLTTKVTVSDDAANLPLPPGPTGEQGQRGRPRATFRKMGAIADAAARPVGLGAEDRGKWWHRLDTNGMDVWTGADWRHSPDAVGPRGGASDGNSITVVKTVHQEQLTNPAVVFKGQGADQRLEVTAPAGAVGPRGPVGTSGAINQAPDFDPSIAPSQGGLFAYQRGSRKFRPAPAPNGFGPWAWYETDFAADQEAGVAQLMAGTFQLPALPFAWRPIVYGNMTYYSQGDGGQHARITARLLHGEGEIVAMSGYDMVTGYLYAPFAPAYSDSDVTKTLSPTSTYGTVPVGQAVNLVVTVDRLRVDSSSTGAIGYKRSRASLVVFAQPI